MSKKFGRILGLIIVTVLAAVVAAWVTVSGWTEDSPEKQNNPHTAIVKTPVSVMEVRRESIEITDSYSGMIRPFERFLLGFEIAGRVSKLGRNAKGESLDEYWEFTKRALTWPDGSGPNLVVDDRALVRQLMDAVMSDDIMGVRQI